MMQWLLRLSVLILIASAPSPAADYYVDNVMGDDTCSGTSKTFRGDGIGPFRTITRGANAARPGDTVHVVPTGTVCRQTADLYGMRSGRPGRPIVIDGHGVTLSGAEPLRSWGWRYWKDGVYTRRDMPFSGILIVDGEMRFEVRINRMLSPGEVCYPYEFDRLFMMPVPGKTHEVEVGQPDADSAKLDPKNWQASGIDKVVRYDKLKEPTWVKIDGLGVPLVKARDRLEPGQFCVEDGALYFKPPMGKPMKDVEIEAVIRGNGVQLGGNTQYVVIKNFNATHVYNDGYNIHGNVKNVEFYNCNATQCGDEGFSSHDTCETLLDGAVYTYCDNGICNVNKSKTVVRNVISAYSRHNGYEAQQQTTHLLENIVLIDNPGQLVGWSDSLKAEDVLIIRTKDAPGTVAVGLGGSAVLSYVTTAGNTSLVQVGETSKLSLSRSLFAPGQGPINLRVDDPESMLKKGILRMDQVVLGAPASVMWGYRGKPGSLHFEEWVSAHGKDDAVRCVVREMNWHEKLLHRRRPTDIPRGIGCSRQLIDRYLEFVRQGAPK